MELLYWKCDKAKQNKTKQSPRKSEDPRKRIMSKLSDISIFPLEISIFCYTKKWILIAFSYLVSNSFTFFESY